jgi:hypothetical protein
MAHVGRRPNWPGQRQTVGYTRPPSTLDPASGMLLLTPTLGELGGTLFLPVVFEQAFVRNFDPDVHIWSNPFSTAVDFGIAAPQWTRMEVLAPVVGSRLPVLNASTGEPGWVDAAGVGPVSADDGLPAVLPPTVAAPPPVAAPTEAPLDDVTAGP